MSEVGYFLIAVGVLFDLFGVLGLVRLPDVYNRLQAATKCVTLGTCLILVGAAVGGGSGAMTARALLCAAFVLLTSPVAAHALARGSHRGGVKLWEESVVDKYEEDNEPVAQAGAETPEAEQA
jgi:multicomponent Na+:H+ antiporter subunit G